MTARIWDNGSYLLIPHEQTTPKIVYYLRFLFITTGSREGPKLSIYTLNSIMHVLMLYIVLQKWMCYPFYLPILEFPLQRYGVEYYKDGDASTESWTTKQESQQTVWLCD